MLNNGLDENEIIFGAAAVGIWWIQWMQQLTESISDSTLSGRFDGIFIRLRGSLLRKNGSTFQAQAQLLQLAKFLAEIFILLPVQLQILNFHQFYFFFVSELYEQMVHI